MALDIGCLIHSDLMFYLALHFNSLRCRSLYLPGNVSPDCLGNSPLPACNESGQRLEQLNRRDNQSLIQTAMQNIQAIPSENVLSGFLDFKLCLINLKKGGGGTEFGGLGPAEKETRGQNVSRRRRTSERDAVDTFRK